MLKPFVWFSFFLGAAVILCGCGSRQSAVPTAVIPQIDTSFARPDKLGSLKFYKAPEATRYTMVTGPNGDLWYPSDGGTGGYTWTIADYSLSGHSVVYDVPPPCSKCDAPNDLNVVSGPDHRIWFGQCCQPYFGAMDGKGKTQYYPAGKACDGQRCSIVVGAVIAKDIWFTAESGSSNQLVVRVGYIDTRTEKVTAYSAPSYYAQLAGEIVLGPDRNLWFADGPNIGRVATSGGVTLFKTTRYTNAEEIIVGPDKNLWYTSPNSPNVERMNASGKVLSTFFVRGQYLRQLALGPDNHVWITATTELIRMTTPKTYQRFPVKQKGGDCQLHPLTIGSDGALWVGQAGYETSGTCSFGVGTFIKTRG